MEKISIVVPTYNSQDCLEELVTQIQKNVKNYEVILVNDCSLDNSWEVIKKISSSNDNVKGINLMKNTGQDNAIMAGLHFVTGDYIVIMDDDLQHDPSDISSLYNALLGGYDVCYANFSRKEHAMWKNFGSWLNGKIAEIVIEKPREVYLSPYKIMKRKIADEILKYTGPYPYIDGLIFRLTKSITQIDARHSQRFAGKSNYSLATSVKVSLKLATSFSVIPLRISSFVGFAASSIAVLLAAYYMIEYFTSGISIEGWTSLTLILLFLGGMILISLGMIGEYVGRMYMLTNNMPQFTIRETCSNAFTKKTE